MLKNGMMRATLLLGIGCVACCALPLLGLSVAGAMALSLAFVYGHWLWLVASIALLSVGWLIVRRKKTMTCDLDGPCKPT